MDKVDKFQNESASKGNSEDSLLIIYILRILKKYSSPDNKLSSQDVIDYLREDYSIGNLDKAEAQRKKVRRHLDTLCEFYPGRCIKKDEGKTRNGHKWFYDVSRDKFAKEEGVILETLSKEEMYRFLIQAKEYGLYELFVLELSTGVRRGELLALKWSDLNMRTGNLNISRQVYTVNGELIVDTPKTKASIRTIVLPKDIVEMLKEYKKTVDSDWIFPSPKNSNKPRWPSAVRNALSRILERAECNNVRFHDLRHTFATMSLEYGMDVKTLSSVIGHTSVRTTLDIYSHTTDTMQQNAATKIDKGIAKNEETEPTEGSTQEAPQFAKFEAKKNKYRKPGTGCVYKINDHLYEGKYSPTNAYGKRISKNVYAKTEEECEEKLAEMIKEMKAEIKREKEMLLMGM